MRLIVIGENKPDCLRVLLKHMPPELKDQAWFLFWTDDRNFNVHNEVETMLEQNLHNWYLYRATDIIAQACSELNIPTNHVINEHPLIVKLYLLFMFSNPNCGEELVLFCDDDVVFFRNPLPLFTTAMKTGKCYYQTERIYGRFDHSAMSLFELSMYNEVFRTNITPEQYNEQLLNSGVLLWETNFPQLGGFLQNLANNKRFKWFWHNRMDHRSRVFFIEQRFTNFVYLLRQAERFDKHDVEFTNTFSYVKIKKFVPSILHYAHGDKDMPQVLTWLNNLVIDNGNLVCSIDKDQFNAMQHNKPHITKNPTKVFKTQKGS